MLSVTLHISFTAYKPNIATIHRSVTDYILALLQMSSQYKQL